MRDSQCRGWVRYDYQCSEESSNRGDAGARSRVPALLLSFLGYDYFHTVVEVDLKGGSSDAEWSSLEDLPDLKSLWVRNTMATDIHLRSVAGLHQLERLHLRDARLITDEGIGHLSSLENLEHIQINNSQITDAGLGALAQLPRLHSLSLQFNSISDEGVARLSRIDTLESIWICGRSDSPNKITDGGLDALHSLPRLQELGVQHTYVSSAGIRRLKRKFPECKVWGMREM